MLQLIGDSLEKLKAVNTNDENMRNDIESLITNLKNIKIFLDPVKLNISSTASTLTPSTGALIKCSFSPSPGTYLSIRAKTLVNNLPSSNITDSKLGVNILPFAGCSNPANPTMNPAVFPWVCLPQLSPFIATNPTTLLEGVPITTVNSKATCTYAAGGVVNFINSGQINVKTS